MASPRTSARQVGGAREATDVAHRASVERRLRQLEAQLAEAATERHRLEEQVAALAAQVGARRDGSDENATARTTSAASPPLAAAPAHATANTTGVAEGLSTMERALTAAGLDAAIAADIKRRQDELVMSEMYLRDQATREQWLNSPRFTAEMAAIEAQRTPLRTEIGDDVYDRYLFALGEPNRVRIEDVMLQSPAALAGLQAGDLVVRYGEARLFTPGELVSETRSGSAGEVVQLEIIRNGERLAVEVPRGPLGLRVAATQGSPDAS